MSTDDERASPRSPAASGSDELDDSWFRVPIDRAAVLRAAAESAHAPTGRDDELDDPWFQ